MPEQTAVATDPEAAPAVRRWHPLDETSLAFEGMETGDSRLFTAGDLSWDGLGP
ncbi:hypothetical protein [Streptomyces anthocyanicus]|uniref:hypothetical protein n=1 Tax=Streptomyces anthocyanicus TaxID=68174 RepID=UPI00365D7D38